MKKVLKTQIALAVLMTGAAWMVNPYVVNAQNVTVATQDEYNKITADGDLILTGDGNQLIIGSEIPPESTNIDVEGGVISAGTESNNTLTIYDSKFETVYGGKDGVTVNGNTVTINNCEIETNKISGRPDEEQYTYSVIGGQAQSGGTASNNNVIINNGTFTGTVAGAVAGTLNDGIIGGTKDVSGGTVVNNTVTIYGGTFSAGTSKYNPDVNAAVQGGYADNGNVEKNKVYIYGGTYNDCIVGGESRKGNANYNEIIIGDNKDIEKNNMDNNEEIYGGYVIEEGNANHNKVTFYGGKTNSITGGRGHNGESNYNEVYVYGGEVKTHVTGGGAANDGEGGKVEYNKVFIYDGEIGGNLEGGNSSYNDVNNNELNILGGKITDKYDRVVGGSSNTGNVENNKVNISGGEIASIVYGGRTNGNGKNTKNIVTITDGTLNKDVYGGYNNLSTGNGSIEKNKVILSKGNVTGTVYGGYTNGSGDVIGNTAVVAGGSVGKYVYGGSGKGRVEGNIVEINGDAAINNLIIGGYNTNKTAGSGTLKSNVVNIIDGNITTNVYGGYSNYSVAAENNEVNITGGTVNSNVYGGRSTGEVDGNEVIISGKGDVNGVVYGGYSTNGTANNNKITLTGTADVSNASLYGANKTGQTGNTLSVDGWSGETKKVGYFNNIDFSNTQWDSGNTVLKITDGTENALQNTQVSVGSMTFDARENIEVGDSKVFIDSTNATGLKLENVVKEANFTQGVVVSGKGEFGLEGNTNNLVYRVTNVEINDQTNLVAENRAVAAAFINQGTDLISDSLDTLSRDGKYGVKTFAAVHGNRSKYDVNSDIKINGWSTIVGVGSETEHNGGDFSWGAFYENGSGNYRTYNSFNNEFFRGDGSLVYNGGGIAARYEQDNGVYTEGSLRAGMLKSDMDNALRDGKDNSYGYESESTYYGAHIGVGKIINLSDDSDLDIYGKFFHTYTDGDSFSVGDDKFEFDDITSDRLRVGARLTTNKENAFSTYYGLAYEYEFNGDADMKAAGMSAPEQSLQGSSYMAEIGLKYQPTPDSPWSLDLNMRGYAGEREGASFNVQATYTF